MRTLALPDTVEHWSLTTLRYTATSSSRSAPRSFATVTFQLAEVAVPTILRLIGALRARSCHHDSAHVETYDAKGASSVAPGKLVSNGHGHLIDLPAATPWQNRQKSREG